MAFLFIISSYKLTHRTTRTLQFSINCFKEKLIIDGFHKKIVDAQTFTDKLRRAVKLRRHKEKENVFRKGCGADFLEKIEPHQDGAEHDF